MLTMPHPMNMAGQVVQTPYGQAFILPSNATILNSNQGQMYAQSTSFSQVAAPAVRQVPAAVDLPRPHVQQTPETGTNQSNADNINDQKNNDSFEVESNDF